MYSCFESEKWIKINNSMNSNYGLLNLSAFSIEFYLCYAEDVMKFREMRSLNGSDDIMYCLWFYIFNTV